MNRLGGNAVKNPHPGTCRIIADGILKSLLAGSQVLVDHFDGFVNECVCSNCRNQKCITRKQNPRLQCLKLESVFLLPRH